MQWAVWIVRHESMMFTLFSPSAIDVADLLLVDTLKCSPFDCQVRRTRGVPGVGLEMVIKYSQDWRWKQKKKSKETKMTKNDWKFKKRFIKKNRFTCLFMQKCLNFNETWQVLLLRFVGHTFLSDSEFEWTAMIFELPFAPVDCAMCTVH